MIFCTRNVAQTMKQSFFSNLILCLTLLSVSPNTVAADIQVVTSIRPIHYLTRAITQGSADPSLLLSAQQSPHHYHLQPSQIRKLHQADVIFWVGESLESTLAKPIGNLPRETEHAPLMALSTLTQHHFDSHHSSAHHPDQINPHIWLTPENAAIIARNIGKVMSERMPQHTPLYEQNLNAFLSRLDTLDKQLAALLQPLHNVKILATHDAWRYLAETYELSGYTAIEADGLEQLGARSFHQLKAAVQAQQFDCIIYGPETNQKKLQQLVGGSATKTLLLDPIGYNLPLSLY